MNPGPPASKLPAAPTAGGLSLDEAIKAVHMVGPEKILARYGESSNATWAAGVVASGIKVDPPRGPMLSVSFKHRDAEMAREVMGALIQAYEEKHEEVRIGVGEYLGFVKMRDQARANLE